MSATRLLVIAFVRAHGRAHGYLIGQELMAWRADKWANTKTGSIYHALRQLSKEGHLLEFDLKSSDSSPARTEYELTDSGEAEFHRLLELALTSAQLRHDMLCAGIVLMSALPRATVVDLLERRLVELKAQCDNVDTANSYVTELNAVQLPSHVEVLLDFWNQQTHCAYEWVAALKTKIASGAFVFCDDAPDAFATPRSGLPFSSN